MTNIPCDESRFSVYISCMYDDIMIAKKIIKLLKKNRINGICPTLDRRGEPIKIKELISQSDVFMPIITKHSLERLWVSQEIGYAMALNIPVLPIAIGQLPHEVIRELHAIWMEKDLTGSDERLSLEIIENLVKMYRDRKNRIPDIFISFKNLDSEGRPTQDSIIAEEIFHFLEKKGLSVFNSNFSLEKLGASAYQKAIDLALDSAQILVAVGISEQNISSQWVRYEWESFYNDILSGRKINGRLFVYIEGFSISSLPRILRQNQVIVHGGDSKEKLYNFIVNALAERKNNRAR